jgi:anaerobic ribonucleoside-triphosphate reductase
MYLKVSYEQEFDDLMMYLRGKYPAELFDVDGIGVQSDLAKFSKGFFSKSVKTTSDISVDQNSNVDDVSVISYTNELKKPFEKINSYYMVWKECKSLFGLAFANQVVEKNLTGDIYINDFHGIGGGLPYCYNYSTYDIMMNGLNMVKKIKCEPPKYLSAFKSQLEQFVVLASNSTLGACGLADLLVVMSYYVKNILDTKSDAHYHFATEEDCWNYIDDKLTSFIYTINQPMRGNQSPFTNVSIYDGRFLDKMIDDYIFPDGSHPDREIVKKVQNLYLDIMNREMDRTPITFPVTTACFSIDDNHELQDIDFVNYIAEKNMKFAFINMYMGKSSTLSSCCRLRSETNNEYFNSFGSGSSKIGSLGVCTVNLPRLTIKYNNKEEFKEELAYLVEMCAKINHAKRKIVQKRIDNGNHPLYDLGFIDINTQYSTCGINGFNEAILYLGEDIKTESGTQLGLEIINVINTVNDKMQKRFKTPHNCEQIPAENVSIKLAKKDQLLKYQTEYNIYSNQFIPLIVNADLLDRIKLQGIFDKHFSGGSIMHISCDERLDDVEDMKLLIKTCAKQGVIYFAINYLLRKCKNGHMTVGSSHICSICGDEIEDFYTRVVGFLTNIKNWHKVRRTEDAPNRQMYNSESIGKVSK